MRAFLTSTLAALALGLPAAAADVPSLADRWRDDPSQIFDAAGIDIAELQWIARPVVVFANSPEDPAYIDQMAEILRDLPELVARDVIVITDTDAETSSLLRTQLRPRGFMLVLMGKDGEVKLRKPLPWTVRELSRSIDKMPMRQREIGVDRR